MPTNNHAVLKPQPLSTSNYSSLTPSTLHLFSISYSFSYIPGSYLVGGPILHLLSLLMQWKMSSTITWITSQDLEILVPPTSQEVKVKPKQPVLTISRLSERKTGSHTENEEIQEVASTDITKNNQYFYEVRYPELIAAMIQVKVVELSRKEGFRFIEYYNSRRN